MLVSVSRGKVVVGAIIAKHHGCGVRAVGPARRSAAAEGIDAWAADTATGTMAGMVYGNCVPGRPRPGRSIRSWQTSCDAATYG